MHTLSAKKLRDRLLKGEVSACEIAKHFLDRVDAYDHHVGAFLSCLSESMMSQAKIIDEKRANKEKLGPLAGIPISIKDNINIKGEKTTCASKFLEDFIAPFDATVVRAIKGSDGLIIGKANLDEFALGSSCEYSALRQTKNPWDLSLTPGGS